MLGAWRDSNVSACVKRAKLSRLAKPFSGIRSEQLRASDDEEELAGVLAEGLAKVLFHAHAWSSSGSMGLQVGHLS